MRKRTFGWIQNPGDIHKLKKVTSIFLAGSQENLWLTQVRIPLLKNLDLISEENYLLFLKVLKKPDEGIDYNLLKGKGSGKAKRSAALCSGIIQACIDAQQNRTYDMPDGKTLTIKKPYTDDWTADGYLRWAISCGLIDYDSRTDTCKLSELGRKLASLDDNSSEEKEILEEALLSYPPLIRILSLLKTESMQTKFDLGAKLGFKDELGFTSIPLPIYLCDYCEAKSPKEKQEIRNNEEGDSDKYARGIASWCRQMGWISVNKCEKYATYKGNEYHTELPSYSLTRAGEKALIKATGNSSNPRLDRVVTFEMLASNKAPGANYLRYVRAKILSTLAASYKTIDQIKSALQSNDIKVNNEDIVDHIKGLTFMGIDITDNGNKYKLKDRIKGLVIPEEDKNTKESLNTLKEEVRKRLVRLDHKYLILIDLAYSDTSVKTQKNADARAFEIQTAELFTNELGFTGKRLGEANRPDVIISYGSKGTIIDNKSYKDGFNIDKHCSDEMSRYLTDNRLRIPGLPKNEWWKEFKPNITSFTFLFVTSYLKGNFIQQLEEISKRNANIKGGAISIESLLYMAEDMKRGTITKESFYGDFCNRELIYK